MNFFDIICCPPLRHDDLLVIRSYPSATVPPESTSDFELFPPMLPEEEHIYIF